MAGWKLLELLNRLPAYRMLKEGRSPITELPHLRLGQSRQLSISQARREVMWNEIFATTCEKN